MTRNLRSWEEFLAEIDRLTDELTQEEPQTGNDEQGCHDPKVLFRGQADSCWELETTLDRSVKVSYTVEEYLKAAEAVENEIHSRFPHEWSSSTSNQSNEIVCSEKPYQVPLRRYDFLVYLRHYGFPSPLLDWTGCARTAAYFALEPRCTCKRSAVFVLKRYSTQKLRRGAPTIHIHGPHFDEVPRDALRRHQQQKGWYTTATTWNEAKKVHTFCLHSDATSVSGYQQDDLFKLTIPRSERRKALKELDELNINHQTLFQTEDALVRTLALRSFDLQEV